MLILLLLAVRQAGGRPASVNSDSVLMEENAEEETGKDYIKWVDFNVSCEALSQAYETDVDTYREDYHIDWISLLAYTAARNGGEFGKQALKDMDALTEKIKKRGNHSGRGDGGSEEL